MERTAQAGKFVVTATEAEKKVKESVACADLLNRNCRK